MKIQSRPLICVRDVEKSSLWYQKILGCKSGHGGDEYEMLLSGRTLILQLHAWKAASHDHDHLGSPKKKPNGNGVAIWFHIDDIDAAAARAKKLKAKILEPLHENPLAYHRELWLEDLDGYVVVLSGK